MPRKKRPRSGGRKTKQDPTVLIRFFQVLLIMVIVAFAGFLIFNNTRHFLYHTDFFAVKEVVKSPSLSFISSRYLQNLLGRNIFTIDLKKVQQQLQKQYPHIDQLRVVRGFPNRLYLDARTRDPLVWARMGGQPFFLDKKAIVLPVEKSTSSFPEILGLDQQRRFVVGKPLAGTRIRVALDIVRTIQSDAYLSAYAVKKVDVQHLSRIGVTLESAQIPLMSIRFSVIMDDDRISQKVKTLGILLSQGNLNPQEIKYIDLRFKEPILARK